MLTMKMTGWAGVVAAAALTLSGCAGERADSSGSQWDPNWNGADTSSSADWGTSQGSDTGGPPTGNTNVSYSGDQDFGYFRRLVEAGQVPQVGEFDASGFFAEHHTPLPEPVCGERICLQPMLGVMGNFINGNNCTMLQVGLNSPIVADPSLRPPLSLAVVVDISGSMNTAGKIDFVRSGLSKMVNELNDDDQIALITYSTSARTVFPMQPIKGQRNDLQSTIDNLVASGSTNLYDGLEAGFSSVFASYDSGRQNRVLLLSDGEPTTGNTNPDDIIAMSGAYNSDGVGLTTVGLGTDFNYDLMSRLARQADGNFYFVEDSSAVDEVFTQELSYFTVPVAFDLQMTLRSGSDYTFGRAMGTPLWEDTEEGGQLSIPSVFLAHRTAHDDVEPGGERRGGGSALLVELMPREDDGTGASDAEVAIIDLSFREPGTNRIVEDSVVVQYPHAPWFLSSTGFFDSEIVTKSFVMLNIYVALEEAVRMFHMGAPDESVRILRRTRLAAADYEDSANDGTGDVDIQLDMELMLQLENLIIEQTRPPEPDPSEFPEDPWPAD